MVSVQCRTCGMESNTCGVNTLLSLQKNTTIRKAVHDYTADIDLPDYKCETYVRMSYEYWIDKQNNVDSCQNVFHFSHSCEAKGAVRTTKMDMGTNSNILVHYVHGQSMLLDENLQIGEVWIYCVVLKSFVFSHYSVTIPCCYHKSLFQCDYHLKGIVSLGGHSTDTRHYKTYQHTAGKWLLFDDNIVVEETPSFRAPWYLVMYQKGKCR